MKQSHSKKLGDILLEQHDLKDDKITVICPHCQSTNRSLPNSSSETCRICDKEFIVQRGLGFKNFSDFWCFEQQIKDDFLDDLRQDHKDDDKDDE